MKRFWMVITMFLLSFSLFATVAEAKRLGGGGNTGKQRNIDQQQMQKTPTNNSTATNSTAAPAQAPATPPAASGASKWLGPLAGLAIGAGLATLLAGSGLGGALGGILLAILAAVIIAVVVAKLRKSKQAPAQFSGTEQYAGAGAPYQAPAATQPTPAVSKSSLPWDLATGSATGSAPSAAAAARNIPADFPVESFLRSAKTSFIRLQAANDRKDLNDIREYTTPEMFAEISMQMQERGDAPQKTNVIQVIADLIEVANEGNLAIASVRFTGQLNENNGPTENIDEIWHVQKDLRDDKAVWLLTGIQQNH